jgi:hypothetical protein
LDFNPALTRLLFIAGTPHLQAEFEEMALNHFKMLKTEEAATRGQFPATAWKSS